jgi:hypothetical protein
MRNYIRAAAATAAFLLASASNASTFITYTGTGHGEFLKFDINNNLIRQGGAAFTYTLRLVSDTFGTGCFAGPITCTVSPDGVGGNYSVGSNWETLSLSFTGSGSTKYPDASATLLGGSATSFRPDVNFSRFIWYGTVDSVQVTTSEGPFAAGTFYVSWSATGVPEPTTWALMIAGFALVGGAMRRRDLKVAYA